VGLFQGLCSPYKKNADKYIILEQRSDFTFYTFSKIMRNVSIFHNFLLRTKINFTSIDTLHLVILTLENSLCVQSQIFYLSLYNLRDHKKVVNITRITTISIIIILLLNS